MTSPLVLTLALGRSTQERFERERERLFPAGRTQVGAHATLFHALPPTLEEQVRSELAGLADLPSPAVEVTGVLPLGRGAAYELGCGVVEQLRADWRRRWSEHLTRQDDQGLRLHVTVQNKVEPAVARRTVEELRSSFSPWRTRATAVRLWRYDGGPWTHLVDGPFGSARQDG